MRRAITVLMAAGALAVPAAAAAEPGDDPEQGNGAEHISVSQCHTFGMGNTVCIEQEGVTNSTENANNISGFTHVRQIMLVSNQQCTIDNDSELKLHFLFQKGEGTQVFHRKSESVVIAECAHGTVRCTVSATHHFANGEVQYDTEIVRCEDL